MRYFFNTESGRIENLDTVRTYHKQFGNGYTFRQYLSACMTENGGIFRPLRQHIIKLEDELKRADELDDDERKEKIKEIENLRRLEK